jgi:protein-disulfide isomerase
MTSARTARRSSRRRGAPVRRGPSPALIAAVAVVVLFAAVVGFGVYRAARSSDAAPAPPRATVSGVVVGRDDAPVTVDVYLDFQCPACRAFEQQSGATLDELAASGAARVIYHPVAYLNRFSSTRYSSRSSAASGCAAEAGVFTEYVRLLFAHQPPEGGHGLPEEQLVELGEQAGAGPGFTECVSSDRYAGWSAALTDEASRSGVNVTPTVMVDGREVERTAAALRAAVDAAS